MSLPGLVCNELKGKTGLIVSWDPGVARYGVSVLCGGCLAIRPINLVAAEVPEVMMEQCELAVCAASAASAAQW